MRIRDQIDTPTERQRRRARRCLIALAVMAFSGWVVASAFLSGSIWRTGVDPCETGALEVTEAAELRELLELEPGGRIPCNTLALHLAELEGRLSHCAIAEEIGLELEWECDADCRALPQFNGITFDSEEELVEAPEWRFQHASGNS